MNARQTTLASAVAALLAAGALPAALAQGTQLNPPSARISDEAIQADQRAYETLQGRIKGLNDKGRPVRDYHLSKAQCWLDVSFHEYTRNDRSSFPQEAMTESEKLIAGMERGAQLGTDTPLVGQAIKLRPDLWDKVTGLKDQPGFRCAQHKVACAEVELVHAGNEHAQQQWRHAKPYVQIAEDLIAEAELLSKDCPGVVQPDVVVAPPPCPKCPTLPPPPSPAPVRDVSISANAVFSYDRADVAGLRGPSMEQLRALAERLKAGELQVKAIRLTGHADRTGDAGYNQRLSERRVQTVRDVLVGLGVDAKLITTAARGETQQIEPCQAGFRSQTELQECLLPNRRVEIEIDARTKN